MRRIHLAVVSFCVGALCLVLAACSRAPVFPVTTDQLKSVKSVDQAEQALTDWMRDQSGVRSRLGKQADVVFRQVDQARRAAVQELVRQFRPAAQRTRADVWPRPKDSVNAAETARFERVAFVSGPPLVLARQSEQGTATGAGAVITTFGLLAGAAGIFGDARRDEQGNFVPPPVDTGQELDNGVTVSVHIQPKLIGSRLEAEVQITTSKKDAGYEEKGAGTMSMDLCPDARGAVPLQVAVSGAVTAGNNVQFQFKAQATGHVDDEANLTDFDLQSRSAASVQPGDKAVANGANNQYLEWDLGFHLQGVNGGKSADLTDFRANITRQSSKADQQFFDGSSSVVTALMEGTVMMAFVDAEQQWHNGYCVAVSVPEMGSNAEKSVPSNSETPFTAVVRHKFEGNELKGPVMATLRSGAVSVNPSATKLPAPAKFLYKAPGKTGKAGSVDLESRSKRGIGKLVVTFTIGGYEVDGPFGDGHMSGIICSGLGQPFTLDFDTPVGLVGTFTFRPSSESGGTWKMAGHFQDIVTNTASGSYAIEGFGEGRPRIVIPADSRGVQTTRGFGSVNYVGGGTLALQPLACK